MSDPARDNLSALDIDLARRIDEVCRRFEADWREGRQPRLEEYFGEFTGDAQASLATELEALQAELEEAAGEIGIADAQTIAPGSLPTQPKPGEASSSVHDVATLQPLGDATVDLGSSAPAPSEARTPSHGRYFGDYEILRELARGGMGVVFEARQVSLNRKVALKMILAGQLANQIDVKRFHTEAEAAANLDHPGIVPVFEVGEHEGQHYFSMGFVEGQSLSQRLAEGPLPAREAAALVVKVAEAIEFAHQRGVIHRDLKPANILLDKNGNPRVTDFGLAKKVQGDSGLTGSGQIMGTPSYMPPEQAGGKRGEVGPAADVYALGATLYALVTGRPPFQAATPMDTIIQVISDEPVPPRRLNPSISRDVETICVKCLEKDPARRYTSAAALAEELGRFLAGEPIVARPVGRAERAWRWCRRKPVLAAMALALAVATLAGLSGIVWQWSRAETERGIAQVERDEAKRQSVIAVNERNEAEKQRALAVEREAATRSLLYASRMNLALRSWQDKRVEEVLDYLTSQVPKPGQSDLRGPEWHLLWRLCHAELKTIPLAPAFEPGRARAGLVSLTPGHTRLSADGRQMAIASPPFDQVVILDCLTGQPAARLNTPMAKATAKGLPDIPRGIRAVLPLPGDRVAISTDDEVSIRDTKTNRILWKATGHTGSVTALALGGVDNKYLVTGSRTQNLLLTVWDVSKGKAIETVRELDARGVVVDACCALSPAGDRLAGAVTGERLRVWQIPGGRILYTTGQIAGRVTGIAFSSDGKTIAVASSDGTVSLRDAASGEPKAVWRAQAEETAGINSLDRFITLAFSPDSKRILIGSRDATVQVCDVATGHLQQTFKGHTGAIAAVAFLPNEQILSVSIDGTMKLWPDYGGVEASVLKRHSMQVSAIAFSPDGRWLASGSLAGYSEKANVKLWNAMTGSFVRQFAGHNGAIQALAFSPDSRQLASASMDKTVKVWDITTGQLVKSLTDFRKFVDDVAFLSDRKRLLTRCFDEVRIWSMDTGLSQAKPLQVSGWNTAVSADGNWLASIDPYSLVAPAGARHRISMSVHDLRHDDEVRKLTYEASDDEATIALGLSADGNLLADGRANGTVAVWNVGTGKVQTTWKYRVLPMTRPAFSPDARRLLTLSLDGKLKLWDVASGQEVYTLSDTTGGVQGLEARAARYETENRLGPASLAALYGIKNGLGPAAFSPTGDRIAAPYVNSVLLWNIAPGAAGPAESSSSRESDVVPGILVERRPPATDGCTKNLQLIARAMTDYLRAHSAFPKPAIADDKGRPLLSWRVAVLPELGQRALYDRFNLNEPWDGPHNKSLLKDMPALFSCPGRTNAQPFTTTYRVFSGKGALFEQNQKVGIANVPDGTANTILVVEAEGAVPWTKPDELVFDPAVVKSFQGAGSPHPDGFYASFADGSVRFIKEIVDPKVFRNLITPAGFKDVTGDAY